MSIFAVIYQYIDDSAARDAFRPEHRNFLKTLDGAGNAVERLESGPWVSRPGEPDGALLMFRAADADAVAATLDGDPFHRENLIANRVIREWTPVSGPWS